MSRISSVSSQAKIYIWVRQVLEQTERAFQVGPRCPANLDNVNDRKIEQLEVKLAHKNEITPSSWRTTSN
jgi:hypothetical protein